MELRNYLAIARRSWPLVLALPLLAALATVALWLIRPPQYGATARLLVTQTAVQPEAGATDADLNLDYSWNSSEYIIDDLPAVLTSDLFARDVSTRLGDQGLSVDPGLVRGSLTATTLHRIVTLQAVTSQPETTVAVLRAAAETLQANGLKYWDRTEVRGPGGGLDVAILDLPQTAGPVEGLRELLVDVALRVALALVAGVGLAFLVHYLDNRLHQAAQVEQFVGLPVIGVIPRD